MKSLERTWIFGWNSEQYSMRYPFLCGALFFLIGFVSFIMLMVFLSTNLHTTLWADQSIYRDLAKMIREQGLFDFKSDLRTYLYPLFIAINQVITLSNDVITRIVMSLLQWLLLLSSAYIGSKRWAALSEGKYTGLLIFSVIVLNPWLIQACTLLLTDIVFSVFCMWSIILFFESDPKINQWLLYSPWLMAVATMARPAGIFICTVIILAVIIRAIVMLKNKTEVKSLIQKIIICILGLVLIFSPQLFMNQSKFGQLKITPVINFSDLQIRWGLQLFKARAVVNEDKTLSLLASTSPFAPVPEELFTKNLTNLLQQYPIAFVVGGVAHAFSLLDWASVETYPRYPDGGIGRLFFSLLLYAYWFIAGYGLFQILRKGNGIMEKRALGFVIFCGVYAIPLLVTAVEVRFAYLIYLLLSPVFAVSFQNIWKRKYLSTRKQRRSFIGLFIVFVALMISYSIYCDYLTGQPALFRYMQWFY